MEIWRDCLNLVVPYDDVPRMHRRISVGPLAEGAGSLHPSESCLGAAASAGASRRCSIAALEARRSMADAERYFLVWTATWKLFRARRTSPRRRLASAPPRPWACCTLPGPAAISSRRVSVHAGAAADQASICMGRSTPPKPGPHNQARGISSVSAIWQDEHSERRRIVPTLHGVLRSFFFRMPKAFRAETPACAIATSTEVS